MTPFNLNKGSIINFNIHLARRDIHIPIILIKVLLIYIKLFVQETRQILLESYVPQQIVHALYTPYATRYITSGAPEAVWPRLARANNSANVAISSLLCLYTLLTPLIK